MQRSRPLLPAVLLLAVWVPEIGFAATDLLPRSRFPGCETTSIAPGDPDSGWTLVEGFEPAENEDPSAWVGERATALLIAGKSDGRRLRIVARAERKQVRLNLLINGIETGSELLSRTWRTFHWPLPADALRIGPNLLELRTGSEGRARPRRGTARAAIQEIALVPRMRCGAPASAAGIYEAPTPVELWPDRFVFAPAALGRASDLEIAFVGGPSAALAVACITPAGVEVVDTLVAKRQRVRDHLSLPEACASATGLVFASSGGKPLQLTSARVSDGTGWSWRHGIRSLAVLAVAVLVAACVLIARLASGRESGRRTPWVDAAVLVVLAGAVRLAFLELYPYPGAAGDTGGYLAGAGRLVAGADLLGSSGWHAWQTYLRPPGYYLFLAAFTGPQGLATGTVIYLQAILSALAAGFTYLLGRQLFGRAAALVAGLLFALHVESIATFSRILSEPLFMLFMLPGLAALARVSRSPSWAPAALAGLLFGAAALIRSGPVEFTLLAGMLLLVIHGFRPGVRAAGALVGGMLLVAAPWAVRNAIVEGRFVGLETVSIANLLQDTPQHGFFPSEDLDLETGEGRRVYRQRMSHANPDGEIDRQRGRVMRAVLLDTLTHPAWIVENVVRFFGFMPERYMSWVLREQDAHRVAWLSDLMNAQLLVVLVLGFGGLAWHARDSRVWPLALWFALSAGVIILLFHPMPRYRLPTVPVLMVFAGAALTRSVAALAASGAGPAGPADPTPPAPPARPAPRRAG